jgi:protein-disulfide isomerase-like protein with CxxC motif
MFNRVHHFIKKIALNSGLNREEFINNKKNVNKIVNKNKNNTIIIRKMSTQAHPSGNNNNNNNMGYVFIMALGVYISHNFDKRGKN